MFICPDSVKSSIVSTRARIFQLRRCPLREEVSGQTCARHCFHSGLPTTVHKSQEID